MEIRQATENDLDRMVDLDKEAYGEYGASRDYLAKKLTVFPKGAIVSETDGKLIGFVVFEILDKNGIPEDFRDMELFEPIESKWMHPVVFTTASNYKDKVSDSKLLLAAENIAKTLGCLESCVPLSKDHPFKENGAFEFWEMNGYERIGKIKWMPNENEFIECFVYRKILHRKP